LFIFGADAGAPGTGRAARRNNGKSPALTGRRGGTVMRSKSLETDQEQEKLTMAEAIAILAMLTLLGALGFGVVAA
jgi:hypothetical protein